MYYCSTGATMRLLILSLGLLAGCDSPRGTKKATEPEPASPGTSPRRLAVPTPKSKEFVRPPLVEPKVPPEPPRPATFDEAWSALPTEAAAFQRQHDEEYERKVRLLTDDEVAEVKEGLRLGYPYGQYPMRKHGFTNWLLANAIRDAHKDGDFKKVARLVWDRSPPTRNQRGMVRLAVGWGLEDVIRRDGIRRCVESVESNTRKLSAQERDIVIDFAGEDYYANRP